VLCLWKFIKARRIAMHQENVDGGCLSEFNRCDCDCHKKIGISCHVPCCGTCCWCSEDRIPMGQLDAHEQNCDARNDI